MLGAIAGDIIGSYYEFHKIKTKEFDLFHPNSKFTDDTRLSMAIAKSIMDDEPYLDNIVDFGLGYFDVKVEKLPIKRWEKKKSIIYLRYLLFFLQLFYHAFQQML